MSKIKIQNQQLPMAATVKYIRDDNGSTVSQSVPKRNTVTTKYGLRDNTNVTVYVWDKSHSITYENGHDTLVILQEGAQNDFGLNWK